MKVNKPFYVADGGIISLDKQIAKEDFHLDIEAHKREGTWVLTIHVKGPHVRDGECIRDIKVKRPLSIGCVQQISQRERMDYLNLTDFLEEDPLENMDPRDPELLQKLEEVSLLQFKPFDEDLHVQLQDIESVDYEVTQVEKT